MKNTKLYLINNLLAVLVTPLAMLNLSFKLSGIIANKVNIPIDDKIDIFKNINTLSIKVFIISVLFAIVTLLINNIFEEKQFKLGQIIITILLSILAITLITVSVISSMG